TIEHHPTIPAVIVTWHEEFDFSQHGRPQSAEMREILNAQESPIFYIMDISVWHNMPFNDLIEATALAARGNDANFHHPMNMGTLIISTDPAVRISALGTKSDAFGNANVMIFNNLDDALTYASEQAA